MYMFTVHLHVHVQLMDNSYLVWGSLVIIIPGTIIVYHSLFRITQFRYNYNIHVHVHVAYILSIKYISM